MIASTTLVAGTHIAARETAIVRRIRAGVPTAVILEGIPNGSGFLAPSPDRPELMIARIAPGCMCCTGNLTLRVTLNRMLRRHPHEIYISVANATHLGTLRQFLSAAPYDTLLQLAPAIIDCDAPPRS